MNTLGEKIYKLRKREGLSQEEFADKLGVSRQAVSLWETDTQVPKADKISAMCLAFSVSSEYFLADGSSAVAVTNDEKITEKSAEREKKKLSVKSKIIAICLLVAVFVVAFFACFIIMLYSPDGTITSAITIKIDGVSKGALIAVTASCAAILIIPLIVCIFKILKK